MLKGSAVPLGLGTIDPCCWSSITLPEMTSLQFMLSIPYGEMPLLNDWLKSAPPSQPRVAPGIIQYIFHVCPPGLRSIDHF